MDRIRRILEVTEHPRPGRADLTAGRGESLRDPVVAQAALVHRTGPWIDKAAAVGTGLDAVAAPEAVISIHQDHTVRALEGRADRTHLDARRVRAVVAELNAWECHWLSPS